MNGYYNMTFLFLGALTTFITGQQGRSVHLLPRRVRGARRDDATLQPSYVITDHTAPYSLQLCVWMQATQPHPLQREAERRASIAVSKKMDSEAATPVAANSCPRVHFG